MRRTLGRITVFSILAFTLGTGIFLVAAWSIDDALQYEPSLQIGVIQADEVSATSFLVFDMQTGTEIASKNSTAVVPIASITKLFTAASFLATADLDATTTILWSDVNTEGRAGKLRAYEEYQSRELLFPLLLESSNDAAVAMLRLQPTLLEIMRGYASTTGLFETHFEDTSGLSDKNVSNAYELFLLTRKLYFEKPHIFDITRLPQYIGTHTGWSNNNPLLASEGYQGGKHGFTYEANRTGIFLFEEVLTNNHKRIIGYVVLGSEDLAFDVQVLRKVIQKNVRFQ